MSKTLAESLAVVTEEEQDLGSILIDLGGGSTDVIVLLNGAPIFTTSIPIGGITVTNDISIVRGISTDTAEEIKLQHGCCWDELVEDDETVLIPGVGGRPPEEISRHEITAIIQPRIEEILNMVRQRIAHQTKLKPLSGNVVLTGGGALMSGIIEMACKVFDTQSVRIGMPSNYGDIKTNYRSPEFATVVGLVVSNCKKKKSSGSSRSADTRPSGEKNKFWKSVGNFFKEFF
jgi:cell division protein FtsA